VLCLDRSIKDEFKQGLAGILLGTLFLYPIDYMRTLSMAENRSFGESLQIIRAMEIAQVY